MSESEKATFTHPRFSDTSPSGSGPESRGEETWATHSQHHWLPLPAFPDLEIQHRKQQCATNANQGNKTEITNPEMNFFQIPRLLSAVLQQINEVFVRLTLHVVAFRVTHWIPPSVEAREPSRQAVLRTDRHWTRFPHLALSGIQTANTLNRAIDALVGSQHPHLARTAR